jgi:hypothetical protein
VQTRLGSFVACVLTAVLVVCVASCSNPGPQPNPLPTPVASPVVPRRTASPSPSAEELNLHQAERALRVLRRPVQNQGFVHGWPVFRSAEKCWRAPFLSTISRSVQSG